MEKITVQNRHVWIGNHSHHGFILFDENNQIGVNSGKVRLYRLKEQKSQIFVKKVLRQNLLNITKTQIRLVEKEIDTYGKKFVKKRVTHCFECKQDLNSVDFSICFSCGWIECDCGACGCEYQNFE